MLSAFCYQFILMLHCRQLKYKHICSPSKINIIYLFLSLHLCRFFSFSLSLSYFFHNRTFSGCSSLPNPDSQSWLGLCEWKSLEVSTVPHQSGREGTHSVSIPTAVTGAETNRWLVGDYWGEQVRERGGGREMSFQKRREVFDSWTQWKMGRTNSAATNKYNATRTHRRNLLMRHCEEM